MSNKHPWLVSLVVLIPMATATYAAVPDEFVDERKLFMQAHTAFEKGNATEFKKLRGILGTSYPIAYYLDYLGLRKTFAVVSPTQSHLNALHQFERETKDENLTRKLTRQLQARAATTKQWPIFRQLNEYNMAASMPCATLQAQANAGNLNTLNPAALELWVQPKKHPKACVALLDKLESRKAPPIKAIWQRIYESMDETKPQYAESVLHYLSQQDQKPVKGWLKARKTPEAYLKSGALKKDTSFNRRAMVDLVLLWSKDDPVAAMDYWLENHEQYRFYDDRYYDTHRLLAMRGAYRRLPEAYEWLNSVPGRDDDLELKEWRIRAALYAQDWVHVLRSLKRLPKEEQEEDHWAYWEARALEEAGHTPIANAIYETLSKLPTYHGFLAADKLGVEYAITDLPIDADKKILGELEQNAELIRAREYYQVDIPWEGRREWNALFDGAKPDKLAALAVLAERWELFDRALFSAGRAEKKKALTTRFPVVYLPEVELAAEKNRIPPAWVFGVMRRESGYIRDVKSSAGAIGLMQLMPNTAKYVAKLQGKKNWNGDLTDVETNIDFGTFYLRHVLDKFDDHQILATASYNAGPKRVSIWLPPEDMSADVWIDAIPYSETRRYVRAVMAYTVIYEWHLTKQPERLSSKLLVVPAASADGT